jgi:crotonobetainyl-CoA:carnitine CoA-transferase CaiB-like acyl-CoA transferase
MAPALGGHPGWAKALLSTNRNKKSVTINLKSPVGIELLKALVNKCDVLIENFLPGTLQRFGLDYESLRAQHPSLIYCSITGYGQTGPYKNWPGYDAIIQAQGGTMSITGEADGAPMKVGVAIVDITAGLFAANAILAALLHRERTGQGQSIDVALLDAQVAWLANVAHNVLADVLPKRYGNEHPSIVPYQSFQTADGWLYVAVGNDAQYKRLCECANCMALWDDERFRTNPGRVTHRVALIPQLQTLFIQRSTHAWNVLLQANNIPVSPINDVAQVLQDPHVLARGMVQEIDGTRMLGPVAKLSATPAAIQSPPPLLGQHTAQVLHDLLGKSDLEIDALRQIGVV